jgi:hypothetical protein
MVPRHESMQMRALHLLGCGTPHNLAAKSKFFHEGSLNTYGFSKVRNCHCEGELCPKQSLN